jgi:hypothetical protein
VTRRSCGECQLCCKLVPVVSLEKRAGEKCRHQRHGKGCMIYRDKPYECDVWNCRWLTNDEAEHLPRPDRAHFVIDVMPDFIHAVYDDRRIDIQVMQVWCDPAYPDAWRDPRMLAYIERIADTRQTATIIRYDSEAAITVFAPSLMEDHQWHVFNPTIRPEGEAGIVAMLNRAEPAADRALRAVPRPA